MFGFRLGNLVVTLAMRAKGEEMKWMNWAMEIAAQSEPVGFPHSPMQEHRAKHVHVKTSD